MRPLESFTEDPRKILVLAMESRAAGARRVPVRLVAGGEGKGVEKTEVTANLWWLGVDLTWPETASRQRQYAGGERSLSPTRSRWRGPVQKLH